MSKEIFTVGHSNHAWEPFAALLKRYEVQVVVDVRSRPSSRHALFANRRRLPTLLDGEGMRHVYLGDSLGGKPLDPSLYDQDGRPDYAKIRSKRFFKDGLHTLLSLTGESTVALMCAEEEPRECHRSLLIGPALAEIGMELRHIRKDGTAGVVVE